MLRTIKKVLDKSLEVLVASVMAILVADVVWQVFTRFILKNPSSWTEELATFLLVWVGLLGASVALNRGAHLGIDYFVGKLSARKRLYIDCVVFAAVAMFSLLVLVIGGGKLVNNTLMMNQTTPALGIKMGYVYLALPISGCFMVLYSVEFLVQTIVSLVKHRESEVLEHVTSRGSDID